MWAAMYVIKGLVHARRAYILRSEYDIGKKDDFHNFRVIASSQKVTAHKVQGQTVTFEYAKYQTLVFINTLLPDKSSVFIDLTLQTYPHIASLPQTHN